MLPSRPRTSAGAIINNQTSLDISPIRPSPSPVIYLEPQVCHISSNNTALAEIGYWGSALPVFELGLLRLDSPALTIRPRYTVVAAIVLEHKSNIYPMKHHLVDILISHSSVTAANTIHMIFSTHALFFIPSY